MEEIWRIVDPEFNRVTEGLQVIEDLVWLLAEDADEIAEIKTVRSKLAGCFNPYREMLLNHGETDETG